MASPTYMRWEATFRGQAAHAGMHPEDGRSAILAAAKAIAAIPQGRIDEETTVNVARIRGGVAGTNVVPEHCTVVGEARSLSDAALEQVMAEIVDELHDAANDPACACDLDVTVERLFAGYRHKTSTPPVQAAEAALRERGYAPRRILSGAASDANAFEAAGFTTRQPRQRDRARPRADRARQPVGARGHARRHLRAARRARGRLMEPQRLVLRRGRVVRAGDAGGPEQELVVDVADRGERRAIADVGLVGPAQPGDEVVVNAQAADLALGSGGLRRRPREPHPRP